MHIHSLDNWRHSHDFSVLRGHGERRTMLVLALTAVTMLVEIVAGTRYGSMALLADGWHMGTHAAAFGITIFAYRYARKHAASPAYAFGTGKVGVLGGFAGAVALAVVALTMLLESGQRLFEPRPIQFNEAIAVAVLGLLVNLISALLLREHHHEHDHHAHHRHVSDHGVPQVAASGTAMRTPVREPARSPQDAVPRDRLHHDHNLKAAYAHVLADALTSILAIGALTIGKYSGWHWLDPLTGMVGAAVISVWAWGLLKETGPILLDGSIAPERRAAIIEKIESALDNRVSDLHVWRVGPAAYAATMAIVTHYPRENDYYRELLRDFGEIAHLTLEIHHCRETPCLPQ